MATPPEQEDRTASESPGANARRAGAKTPELDATAEARSWLRGDSVADAPMPGYTLGRYELLEVLGEGGMGIVYRGYDPDLDREVAIKLLRHGAGDNAVLQRRLLREAQAMARLSHRNLVTVHDVGVHNRHVFIAMELVAGTTLAEWAREQPWQERLGGLIAAGRGLVEAHGAGVVHRDFKPANVLVDGRGRILVADFGLARSGDAVSGRPVAESVEVAATARGTGSRVGAGGTPASSPDSPLHATVTATGAILGTPAYMPPEQYAGGRVDARADQFSFAVSAFELLYGHRPFQGGSLEEIMSAVLAGEIREPSATSGAPRELLEALRPALAARPADRYPSLGALLDALASAQQPVAKERGVPRLALAAGLLIVGVSVAAWALSRDVARPAVGPSASAAGASGSTAGQLAAPPPWAATVLERRKHGLAACMDNLRGDGFDGDDVVVAVEVGERGDAIGTRIEVDPAPYTDIAACVVGRLGGEWYDGSPPEPRRFAVRVPMRRSPPVELPRYRKVGADAFEVARSAVDQILASPDDYLRGARLVPSYKSGERHGLKMYAIRPGSVLDAFGFENGDTVVGVNDRPFRERADFEELVGRLGGPEPVAALDIDIVRAQEPRTLAIRLLDE